MGEKMSTTVLPETVVFERLVVECSVSFNVCPEYAHWSLCVARRKGRDTGDTEAAEVLEYFKRISFVGVAASTQLNLIKTFLTNLSYTVEKIKVTCGLSNEEITQVLDALAKLETRMDQAIASLVGGTLPANP